MNALSWGGSCERSGVVPASLLLCVCRWLRVYWLMSSGVVLVSGCVGVVAALIIGLVGFAAVVRVECWGFVEVGIVSSMLLSEWISVRHGGG